MAPAPPGDQPAPPGNQPAPSDPPAPPGDLEEEELREVEITILGFAKSLASSPFWPARRLADLGPNILRVQFFGTGCVATVERDNWVVHTVAREELLAAAPKVNTASFALAMVEMEAVRSQLLRDGEDSLDFQDVAAARPVTRRQYTKLSRQDLQNSSRLTAAAMSDLMVEGEGGKMTCRLCSWSTIIRVKAMRHAVDQTCQKKKKKKKKKASKSLKCSGKECGETFASVTALNQHYERIHVEEGGGYVCWVCSKPGKIKILKTFEVFKLHLKKTKIHSKFRGFKCKYCKYSSPRGFDVTRHQKRKHRAELAVAAVLEALLKAVTSAGDQQTGAEEETEEVPSAEVEVPVKVAEEEGTEKEVTEVEEKGESELEQREGDERSSVAAPQVRVTQTIYCQVRQGV